MWFPSTDSAGGWPGTDHDARPARTRSIATMLDQAAWLGVTGLDAVATFARDVDVAALQASCPPVSTTSSSRPTSPPSRPAR